jgi:hypothetical protein
MLLQIFLENEKIQVIDESCNYYIWSTAKIMAFVNDWSVKVSWVDYPKYAPTIIEVPEDLRVKSSEYWNVRKFQVSECATSREDRRTRKRLSVGYNPRTCTRDFQVNMTSNYRHSKILRHYKFINTHSLIFLHLAFSKNLDLQ